MQGDGPGRIELLGLDADDTLWHSERYFAVAQLRLVEMLGQWADETVVERRLLETEHANLRLFGYGVKGFTLSTIETAITVSDGRIGAADIAEIIGWGKELLAHPVELLEGVAETIPALAASYRLVLVTKGDLFHQESKVAASGLGDHFSGVEIVSEKEPADYRRLLDRYDVAPERFVMVGNSLRSDVLPVAELGGYGVYVPYHLTWALEHADLPDALADRVRHLSTFAQLPAVLAALGGPAANASPVRPAAGARPSPGRP